MGCCVTAEEIITQAQYLDLVYIQYTTLYELLPDTARPSTDPKSSQPPTTPLIDGVIVSVVHADSSAPKASSKSNYVASIEPSNPSNN